MNAHRDPMPVAAVVVGVDGSPASLAAVDLAATEAAVRRRPLHIVHAFAWPYLNVPLGPSALGPPEGGLRHDAERIVATAMCRARAANPDLRVSGQVLIGYPAPALRDCSNGAALLVLGDRGLGGFTGLLLGSVAVHLTAHAHCPVIIARGTTDPRLPVALGVDGSPANDPAVGFAFEEATLRDAPLVAVHAWTHPVSRNSGDMLPVVYDVAEVEAEEARLLAEALAGWSAKYPDVVVQRELHRGAVRPALIDASRRAQLVVVGARGRGGFTGLLLGSVSQAVLHHAASPVAVIPPP